MIRFVQDATVLKKNPEDYAPAGDGTVASVQEFVPCSGLYFCFGVGMNLVQLCKECACVVHSDREILRM